jgi:NEDD4-binding protein 2
MKKCYIIRGLPGSGKSTLAKKLAGESGKIHSTDDQFIVEGVYVFDPKKLGINHEKNFNNFKKSLEMGVDPVIVDNTNTQKWEYKKYVDLAESMGYQVEIQCVPHIDPVLAAKRNTHGVPEEAIRKMLKRWEA